MNPGHSQPRYMWPWLWHFSPLWPLALWGPVAAAFIAWGITTHPLPWPATLGIAALGLLFWSFFEYLTHRFILHPHERFQKIDRFAYFAHGKHHDEPDHPMFALVPPLNAAMVIAPLLGIFWLALPAPAFGTFAGAFLIGYLIYEYVHYAHHQANPQNRLGKYLRRHHLTHHAHGRAGNFGVSTPLWDFIFRTTLPKPR